MKRRAVLGSLLLVPVAWPALAAPESEVQAAIRAAAGDGEPREGGITISLPARAENGAQVPITVLVDSPQTAAEHVSSIHIIATRNPTPGVASFRLSPALARAELQTRIRVAEDQTVIVLARMSDGTVRRAAAEARVVVGGCV
jgi:sulfur-oxidizing protein SoxY